MSPSVRGSASARSDPHAPYQVPDAPPAPVMTAWAPSNPGRRDGPEHLARHAAEHHRPRDVAGVRVEARRLGDVTLP